MIITGVLSRIDIDNSVLTSDERLPLDTSPIMPVHDEKQLERREGVDMPNLSSNNDALVHAGSIFRNKNPLSSPQRQSVRSTTTLPSPSHSVSWSEKSCSIQAPDCSTTSVERTNERKSEEDESLQLLLAGDRDDSYHEHDSNTSIESASHYSLISCPQRSVASPSPLQQITQRTNSTSDSSAEDSKRMLSPRHLDLGSRSLPRSSSRSSSNDNNDEDDWDLDDIDEAGLRRYYRDTPASTSSRCGQILFHLDQLDARAIPFTYDGETGIPPIDQDAYDRYHSSLNHTHNYPFYMAAFRTQHGTNGMTMIPRDILQSWHQAWVDLRRDARQRRATRLLTMPSESFVYKAQACFLTWFCDATDRGIGLVAVTCVLWILLGTAWVHRANTRGADGEDSTATPPNRATWWWLLGILLLLIRLSARRLYEAWQYRKTSRNLSQYYAQHHPFNQDLAFQAQHEHRHPPHEQLRQNSEDSATSTDTVNLRIV